MPSGGISGIQKSPPKIDANGGALKDLRSCFLRRFHLQDLMPLQQRRDPSLRIDVQRQHDHEEPRRKIGTARCARAGQPTTRSKWQRKSVASSSVSIESRSFPALLPCLALGDARRFFISGRECARGWDG